MATANGTVKKTPLINFSRPRSSGLIALGLDEGDTLIRAAITNGDNEVMLFSDQGKVVRFKEELVRPMSRTARGIRGIRIAGEPGESHRRSLARAVGRRSALERDSRTLPIGRLRPPGRESPCQQ